LRVPDDGLGFINVRLAAERRCSVDYRRDGHWRVRRAL